MPNVTVLLPIYNNKMDIPRSIQSIIKQTYLNWELIIINDGSTDNLEPDINKLLVKLNDRRIKFINFWENRGVYTCLNEGLLLSKGKYITRIDSDDWVDQTKLKDQVDILDKRPEIHVVRTMSQRTNSIPKYGEVTIMYRKSIIDKIGFYDSVRFGADSEFVERILSTYGKKSLYNIDKILYYASIRPNSLTTSKKSGSTGFGSIVRKQYVTAYRLWHKTNKDKYISYPMIKRPFEVDSIMLP
jgi:glycosyltransferase involved in cell wall biosynthesis